MKKLLSLIILIILIFNTKILSQNLKGKVRVNFSMANSNQASSIIAKSNSLATSGTATPPTYTSTPPTRTATPPSHTATPPTHTATPPTRTATPPTGTATPPTHTATPPTRTATPPTHTATPPTRTATPPSGTTTPTHTSTFTPTPHETPTNTPTPSSNEMRLGRIVIRADNFLNLGNGRFRAFGNVTINDLLRIGGDLIIDVNNFLITANNVTVTAINIPIVGEVEIFKGDFTIDANKEEFVNSFEDVLNSLAPAGMRFEIDDITFILDNDVGVKIQGKIILPDYLGGGYVDLKDDHYILISINRGFQINTQVHINQLKIGNSGWKLRDVLIDFNSDGQCGNYEHVGVLYGSANLRIPMVCRIDGEIGICNNYIDYISLTGRYLKIPVGNTGFFITTISASVNNLMPGGPPLVITGSADFSGGEPIPVGEDQFIYLLLLDNMTLTIDLSGLVRVEGNFKVFEPENPPFHIEVNAFGVTLFEYDYNGMSTLNAYAQIDVNSGFSGRGELRIPNENPIFSANANISVDLNFNLYGHADGTLTMPENMPYIGGQTVGNFCAILNNESFTGNAKIGILNLTVKFWRTGDIEFAANFSSSRKFSIPKGAKSVTFDITEPVNQAIFGVKWVGDDTDLILITPSGEQIYPENATLNSQKYNYFKKSDRNEAAYVVAQPEIGTWQVEFINPQAVQSFTADMFIDNKPPQIQLIEPSSNQVDPETLKISWNAYDSDDTANISIYLVSATENLRSYLLAENIKENDGYGEIEFQKSELPVGKWFVQAVINDGKNAPVTSKSKAIITINNEQAPQQPQYPRIFSSNNKAILYWELNDSENIQGVKIYYTDKIDKLDYDNVISVPPVNSTILDSLTPGRLYRFAITSYSENKVESQPVNLPVTLIKSSKNNHPFFFTNPLKTIKAGSIYRQKLFAIDLDNDKLTYEILDGPSLMKIVPGNELYWKTYKKDIGLYHVQIKVKDNKGGSDILDFDIQVVNNEGVNLPPQFVSVPISIYVPGNLYSYPVQAIDFEGEDITYSLDIAPDGMNIDSKRGIITWNPSPDDLTPKQIMVTATDSSGNSNSQFFNLSPYQETFGAYIYLNKDWFIPGDTMIAKLGILNGSSQVAVHLFVILEVEDNFYFLTDKSPFPYFSSEVSYIDLNLPPFFSYEFNLFEIPLNFELPDLNCSIYSALISSDTNELLGNFAKFDFRFSEF